MLQYQPNSAHNEIKISILSSFIYIQMVLIFCFDIINQKFIIFFIINLSCLY